LSEARISYSTLSRWVRESRIRPLGLLVACSGFLRARLYGMRSRKKKRLVEGFKKLLGEVEKSG
jgi:predicted site-specific integrase-resolvase